MNCPTCGALLNDNAKFCSSCGSSVLTEHIQNPNSNAATASETQAENHAYQQRMYQQPYGNSQIYYELLQKSNASKSNKTFKIIAAITTIIAVIAIMLMLRISSVLLMEEEAYLQQIDDYENQIDAYEDRNAVDKTIDAVDSWIDNFVE